MNRNEFADRIADCKKELDYLTSRPTGCNGCSRYTNNVCGLHGPVPEDFVPVGCDQWDFDDVPF